ncbi:HIT family protein [Camelliibacillus cellulosilyticus]|uniref:HIT family protein n=1 Tax=Camelliibacillus cellulosilyticus TaxID=2174486 RepID=A0ABV9GLR7_9BACL
MAHDADCIFCKIIKGDLPSAKVYEDDNVYAFLDISQVTKGHTLVIPKDHHPNVFELPPETAAKLFSVVPKIAQAVRDAYQPLGLNLLNNNGKIADQSVFHFHLHIIPRYGKGDGYGAVWHPHQSQYSADDLKAIANEIAYHL